MCSIAFNEIKFLIWIQENMRSSLMDEIMKLFTKLGDKGLVWIFIGLVFLSLSKYRKTGLTIIISLLFSFIICNLMLKNYVARIRPYDFYPYIDLIIDKQNDFSFPSGHASASFAAAASIYYSKLKYKKINIAYVFIIIAVLISFSRMYLFVHYPSDILGGLITGIISADIARFIVGKIEIIKERNKI